MLKNIKALIDVFPQLNRTQREALEAQVEMIERLEGQLKNERNANQELREANGQLRDELEKFRGNDGSSDVLGSLDEAELAIVVELVRDAGGRTPEPQLLRVVSVSQSELDVMLEDLKEAELAECIGFNPSPGAVGRAMGDMSSGYAIWEATSKAKRAVIKAGLLNPQH